MVMASAAAVASSSRDELDMGMPVRSHTMVWKFNKDSSLHSIEQIYSHSFKMHTGVSKYNSASSAGRKSDICCNTDHTICTRT